MINTSVKGFVAFAAFGALMGLIGAGCNSSNRDANGQDLSMPAQQPAAAQNQYNQTRPAGGGRTAAPGAGGATGAPAAGNPPGPGR